MAKIGLKKKIAIISFVVSNVLPFVAMIIIVLMLVQGAINLGNWIKSIFTTGVTSEDSSWADNIDEDVFEHALVNKDRLKQILKVEEDSYMSKALNFTITYAYDEYGIKLDKDGKEILDENGFPEYEYKGEVEKERDYTFDISQLTKPYRIPWQLTYAVSILASVEDYGATDLDSNNEVDLEDMDSNTVDHNESNKIKVTKKTVKKVKEALQTEYQFVYDYYNSGTTYYTHTSLASLPHTGVPRNYNPQAVLLNAKTSLFDYNFNVTSSAGDPNNYTTSGFTRTPRPDRFLAALEKVGCQESDISIILEIMAQLGGCDEYIFEIKEMFNLEGGAGGPIINDGEVSASGYIWPVPDSKRITSYFGPRKQPTAGASTYHRGIDIGAPMYTNIVAVKDGKVVTATYSSSAGNFIIVDHGNGVQTGYMHCSKLNVGVGDTVKQGEVIALVGNTGVSTGPHLHFAVLQNGTYVNPLNYVQ